MNTYLTFNDQLRTETDADVIANLIRKGWQQTEQPVHDSETQTCQWQHGQWVIEEIIPPLYTAEDWVKKYFTSLEVVALIRLEQNILQQGKTLGPKMLACKQWLETMMFAQSSTNFLPAPYTYAEASMEAIQTI